MNHFEAFRQFVDFTEQARRVRRQMFVDDNERNENDLEHSCQLALLCWWVIDHHRFPLDLSKVLRYSLVHDLVEVYAGDTPYHTATAHEKKDKQNREQQALARITDEFGQESSLVAAINDYEQQTEPESRFVYAMDKLTPVMVNFVEGGYGWRRLGITLEMVLTKEEKIKSSPEAFEVWEEVVERLKSAQEELFGSQSRPKW